MAEIEERQALRAKVLDGWAERAETQIRQQMSDLIESHEELLGEPLRGEFWDRLRYALDLDPIDPPTGEPLSPPQKPRAGRYGRGGILGKTWAGIAAGSFGGLLVALLIGLAASSA